MCMYCILIGKQFRKKMFKYQEMDENNKRIRNEVKVKRKTFEKNESNKICLQEDAGLELIFAAILFHLPVNANTK